ncbi:hypothetical protein [Desulfitobacterium hafniense]|uniref:hypothetical protein n=1 Tax=Desulfitobacterium hafniense TaxID=49338 RepID=UPI00037F8873|nr:hypothetical protein [Desulfitobacterium hafniense]
MARTNWTYDEIITEHDMNEMGQQMNESTEAIEVMKAPTGFPNRVDSTFIFDKATRVFTIQPIAAEYEVYYRGQRFVKTTSESVTVPDITGMHYVYFDTNGTLQCSDTFPGLQNMIYISYIYWNADQGNVELQFAPGDERHGTVMDKATHERLHAVDWTQWVSGLQLYGYELDDDADDAATQVSLNNGVVADEDLFHDIVHSTNPSAFFEQVLQGPAMLPVMYRDGATGAWVQDEATEYPFRNVGAGRVAYNEWNGSEWVQSEVSDEGFAAYYIVFTGDVEQPIKVVQGQRTDTTLSDAQANNDDRDIQWGSQPFQEFKVLYRLIFQTSDSYSSERKVALRDVLDLRAAKRSPGGGGIVPSAHSNLTGLSYEESGHTGFVGQTDLAEDQTATAPLTHGTQTITAPRTSPAKVKIPGRTLVNLLGRDGNCEDVSKWGDYQGSHVLDSSNKVFGFNSIKITIGASFTQAAIHKVGIFDATKYYLVSAYFKNGNATGARIQKDYSGGGTYVTSNPVIDTAKFVRVGMVLSPSQLNNGNFLHLLVDGAPGQYAYVDGIMLNEITAEEYNNLTVEQLLAKYPYVDSVQHLTGAYVANETNDSYLYVMDSLSEGEVYEDGKKNKIWERKVLDGSLPWGYSSSGTGFKNIRLVNFFPGNDPTSEIVTKYDGKILQSVNGTYNSADCVNLESGGTLYISISNADSGWGPDYTPTPEEIAAYFMGWKMFQSGQPSNAPYNGTGAKAWGAINPESAYIETGTQTTVLPTVASANMLNGKITPYQLHYKLATPITVPVETEGDLMLSAGENQLTLGEGVVVREVANPKTNNTHYAISTLSTSNFGETKVKNNPRSFINIYKNGNKDTHLWEMNLSGVSAQNGIYCRILTSNFDPSATYTVTYLAEPYQISASALSAELTHAENLGTVVQDVVEKTSTLETDLSAYNQYLRQRLYLIERDLSNPNLLHNPDFQVNQRGQSSYAGNGYTVDMWTTTGGMTTNVNPDGSITLIATNTNDQFIQKFEQGFIKDLNGRILTFSVELKDGGIYYAVSSPLDITLDSTPTNLMLPNGWLLQLRIQPGNSSILCARLLCPSAALGAPCNIKRIKLELGSISTLANDPPSDYGEQLALCQRYQIVISTTIIRASRIQANQIYFLIPIPVSMRIAPTFSGTLEIYNMSNVLQSGFTIALLGVRAGALEVSVTKTAHGLTDAYLRIPDGAVFDANL